MECSTRRAPRRFG